MLPAIHYLHAVAFRWERVSSALLKLFSHSSRLLVAVVMVLALLFFSFVWGEGVSLP